MATTVRHSNDLVNEVVRFPVSVQLVRPEFIRLPLPNKRCPFTGLSRTTICEICTPSPANNFTPPVKSSVLKKRGARRGIRIVNYDSLIAYLENLPNEALGEISTAE